MTAIPIDTLVTVFGGSGFLGRHVVRALAKRGCRIRVAVRRPHLAGHLQPLGASARFMRYRPTCAIRNRSRPRPRAPTSSSIWSVSCSSAASKASARCKPAGAEAVALAAAAAGAQLIHVSAIGANERSPSQYARSKAMGENGASARRCHPQSSCVPPIVFGPEDDFFNKFAAMARLLPALPLIGGGHTLFQPVFAGDVAAAIAAAIEGRAKPPVRSTSLADLR